MKSPKELIIWVNGKNEWAQWSNYWSVVSLDSKKVKIINITFSGKTPGENYIYLYLYPFPLFQSLSLKGGIKRTLKMWITWETYFWNNYPIHQSYIYICIYKYRHEKSYIWKIYIWEIYGSNISLKYMHSSYILYVFQIYIFRFFSDIHMYIYT